MNPTSAPDDFPSGYLGAQAFELLLLAGIRRHRLAGVYTEVSVNDWLRIFAPLTHVLRVTLALRIFFDFDERRIVEYLGASSRGAVNNRLRKAVRQIRESPQIHRVFPHLHRSDPHAAD